MTAHNEAKKGEIAKTVIMPGDPVRAKLIAETYLENPKLVNSVRGALAYTGEYNNKEVTVMASGMGMPSMGIYATELFNDYDVDQIIRIGTCGSLRTDISVKDVIIVNEAYTTSSFAMELTGKECYNIKPSTELYEKIKEKALSLNIPIKEEKVLTSDIFYREYIDENVSKENCVAVEMEAFALLYLANHFNKKAASVLTVSDSLVTKESLSSEERERCFEKTIKIVLETI